MAQGIFEPGAMPACRSCIMELYDKDIPNHVGLCCYTRTRINNEMALTTKPFEDVVQSHSNQVKDMIES